jgi:redox-sensing transcriptional repressor
MKTTKLPQPVIARLCSIYQLLSKLGAEGVVAVSSKDIENKTGIPSHTVRKDINFLGEIGTTGKGYEIVKLRAHLADNLGLNKKRKSCVVGLTGIGATIVQTPGAIGAEYDIAAGFDSNINILETIKTPVAVFPSYEITEVVARTGIELGILAVAPVNVEEAVDRLVDGGIRGIVNFTPAMVRPKRAGVFVRTVDIAGELRILSAEINNSENR